MPTPQGGNRSRAPGEIYRNVPGFFPNRSRAALGSPFGGGDAGKTSRTLHVRSGTPSEEAGHLAEMLGRSHREPDHCRGIEEEGRTPEPERGRACMPLLNPQKKKGQTDRPPDRQADRQTDRQTGRETETQRGRASESARKQEQDRKKQQRQTTSFVVNTSQYSYGFRLPRTAPTALITCATPCSKILPPCPKLPYVGPWPRACATYREPESNPKRQIPKPKT